MKKVLSLILAVMLAVSLSACAKNSNNTDTDTVYSTEEEATETKNGSSSEKKTAESFSNRIEELTHLSGKGEAVKNEASLNKLTGLSVIRIIEFTDSDKSELVTIYTDEMDSEIYWMEISGYDFGSSKLKFSDGSTKLQITSKSSADAQGPCIWFYTDEQGVNYFVMGEDLSKSADFYRYVQMDGSEKVYKFMKEFTAEGGSFPEGTYDKIEFVGMSDEDVEKNFEKNQQAIDSINSKK